MKIQPLRCCFDGFVLSLRLLVANVPGLLAGGRGGACLTLDQVVRCLSASGVKFEFWRPGAPCWSPVRSTLRQLKASCSSSDLSRLLLRFSSSHFLLYWRHLSVVRPASAGDHYLSDLRAGDCGLSGGFTRGYGWSPVFPSFGSGGRRHLGTLDALCIDWNSFPVNPGLF